MVLNDLKQNLINTIIQSNLSIDCVYFVLKDIMNEVVDIYNKQLQNEEINKENEEHQEKEEGEEETNEN